MYIFHVYIRNMQGKMIPLWGVVEFRMKYYFWRKRRGRM